MSRLTQLALQVVAVGGLLCSTLASAQAAGPRELFIDAAFGGALGEDDAFMLETLPDCFLGSRKTTSVFCVGRAVGADKSARWYGVVATPDRVVAQSDLAVLTAKAAAADGDFADVPKGRAVVNRALGKVKWDAPLTWVHDYSVRDGALKGDAEQTVSLPDGRKATLTAAGLRVDDGTALLVPTVAGRPLMYVSVYAIPKTAVLVAAVEDATGAGEDAVVDNRFVFSEPGSAGPSTGPPVDASCPDSTWCPPRYGALKPLLDRFCSDDFGDDAVAETAALAKRGELTGEDLAVLFNTYGALYGYVFKRKTDYNRFFYGGDAPKAGVARPWLPPPCREAIAKYTAKTAPASLREARDAVKKLWRKHK